MESRPLRRAAVVGSIFGFFAFGGVVGAVVADLARDDDPPRGEQLADAIVSHHGDPHPALDDRQVTLEEYLSAVNSEIECLLARGAYVLGPVPSSDGTQLVFDYAPRVALAGGSNAETIDHAYEALRVAGIDCDEQHSRDVARVWVSAVKGDDRRALLNLRAQALECMGLDTASSDAQLMSALARDGLDGPLVGCARAMFLEAVS